MNSLSEGRFPIYCMTSDYDISFPAKIQEEKNPFDVCACMKPLKINFPQNVSAIEHSLFKKKLSLC